LARSKRAMIISHQHKFIFIKTAKTAGTSIEVFLSQHCGPQDILTPIFPPVEGHAARNSEGMVHPIREILRNPFIPLPAMRHIFAKRHRYYRHMPAWVVRRRVPAEIWNSYFKFCVERNPWEKVLSHYHMLAHREGSLSLDQYLAKGKLPINYVRYAAPSGDKIIVDRVVRYENLMEGLSEVFARLNIPFAGTLGVRAKGEYRTDRTPYQLVYTEGQRRLVERAFAREIEMHGYRFEQNS
jgi:hypothetical protein